jgi:hypothetical protein
VGWSNGLVVSFYDETIKLVQHLDECLNHSGDCIEKYTYAESSGHSKIIWMSKVFFCLQQNGTNFKNGPSYV